MISPNYASAHMLNELVKSYNSANTTLDMMLSNQEYALAYNEVERNLQLLHGLTYLYSNSSSDLTNIISFGKGLYKNSSSYNTESGLTTAFSIINLLGSNTDIRNCYVFGAFYLSDDDDIYNVLGKPVDSTRVEPLIISNDITIDEALDLLKNNEILYFPAPSSNSVLLYKYVISIEFYDGVLKNTRALMYLVDYRKPRGYFGFTDEKVSQSFTKNIINNKSYIYQLFSTFQTNVETIIRSWINLDSWNPSFVEYWRISTTPMPDELKTYINSELGIII